MNLTRVTAECWYPAKFCAAAHVLKKSHLNYHYLCKRFLQPLMSGAANKDRKQLCFCNCEGEHQLDHTIFPSGTTHRLAMSQCHRGITSRRILWCSTDCFTEPKGRQLTLAEGLSNDVAFQKRLQVRHIIFSINSQLGNNRHQVNGHLLVFFCLMQTLPPVYILFQNLCCKVTFF